MMWLQGLSVSCKLMAGFAFPRSFRARAFNPLWNHYRCADGQWLALAMLQADRYWPAFADAIGRPELAADPRFESAGARAKHAAECVAILDAAFASQPRAEWLRRLREHGGDFIFTLVNSVDDLPADPQVRQNDYVVGFDHPAHGPMQMIGVPVRLSATPGAVRAPAPELGQHTEEVLLEVIGLDWERIGRLREQGVI
jgi:crotonobetainyl-CoA:carnitine CoA-transferase CaiB-like acyl-CoA transferase